MIDMKAFNWVEVPTRQNLTNHYKSREYMAHDESKSARKSKKRRSVLLVLFRCVMLRIGTHLGPTI